MCAKVLFKASLIVIFLWSIAAENEKVNQRILKECPLTEYKKFVECAEKLLLVSQEEPITSENITKEAEISCTKCDCQTCKAEDFAERSPSGCCQTCCPFISCETKKCCFKTCHSLCETLECRSSCRQTCMKFIQDQKTDHASEQLSKSEIFNDNALNITTRINLTNIIHNVNNISAPINLHSSNVNDLTIENQNSYQDVHQITNKPCCELISPTKCSAASKFPFVKCQFNKTSHCGESCFRNQLKLSRSPCGFSNFGCGGLKDLYPIGYIMSHNKSTHNVKFNESVVNSAMNMSDLTVPQESTQQVVLPQNHMNQDIIPSFNYPPVYTKVFPRQYYNPYPFNLPLNSFFAPNYQSQYNSNPFHPSNMFYRSPPSYPPIYNDVQVPQMPLYPNVLTYPSPTSYYLSGMHPFQNLQPQFNYQFANYRYQTPQITFPPIYTAFAPPQVASEVIPNPTIGFQVRPPKNQAEILITNKEEENQNKL